MPSLLRIERGPSAPRERPPELTPSGRTGRTIALMAVAALGVMSTLAVGLWWGGRGESVSSPARADPDAVVARVNGLVVTMRDIEVELALQKTIRSLRGEVLTTDPADLAAFRRDILDQLVDQRMLESDAVARGIVVSTEQALADLGTWAPGVDLVAVPAKASEEGVTDGELGEWARRQVTIAQYLRIPEVQAMGEAEVESRGGFPRPASASDIAAALEDRADIVFRFDGFGDGGAPVDLPMAREGSLAPDFSLKNLAGEPISLSSLRGKPVVINFWATWCGPCKVEMPLFEHVYQRNKDNGLVILAVNVQEQPPEVGRFVQDFGLGFPVVLDDNGQISTLYRVRGLPTSIFVSPDGVIEIAHRGSIVQREELLEMVRRIMPDAGT